MSESVLDLFDLTGKTALVTGAGSGIGRAYANGLAEAGATVACVDIDGDRASETAEALPTDAIAVTADVSDESEIADAVERTVREFDGLDTVIPNAGIAGSLDPIETHDRGDWQDVIDVNLTGVFLTAREGARQLVDQGNGGTIISTASIYGFVGSFDGRSPGYTAAKGGVVNLTHEMAVSLSRYDIRVNAIAPGFVETGMFGGHDLSEDEMAELNSEIRERTLLGRLARPEEFRGIVVYLASDASSYVTGQTIPVDGGWLSL